MIITDLPKEKFLIPCRRFNNKAYSNKINRIINTLINDILFSEFTTQDYYQIEDMFKTKLENLIGAAWKKIFLAIWDCLWAHLKGGCEKSN
ncbi:MAG: hypothetical protein LBT10_02315 [Methanobrevibacter sp.]|jgi:hypothetical protein|nr:hypothetical protein [Methanobrevibacter sp.]